MNLKAYLANIGITMKDFSRILGCSISRMSSISTGKVIPSKRLAEKIESATSGEVKIKASNLKRGPKGGPRPKKKRCICDECKKKFLINSVENIS